MYVELTKLSEDATTTTYRFPGAGQPARTLVFDRVEEQIWPEDGRNDPVFQAAARTVVKAWRQHGDDLPRTLYHRS